MERYQRQINTAGIKVKTALSAGISSAADEMTGLGDVVCKFVHGSGLHKLIEAYTEITGKDAGCEAKKQWLNEKFPFR